jgi:AcrR family transcriptional regulator
MAAPKNKQKILDAALFLFNRDGLVNVRLQHISDECVVSLGNMAYHFKNKDAIVKSLWDQLVAQQQLLLNEYRIVPLFEDTERLMAHTFVLQQTYRSFYLDTLEIMRAYPELQAAYQQHLQWQTQQMLTSFEFNVARGAFMSIPQTSFLPQLSAQFWFTSDLWLYRQTIQQLPTDDYGAFRLALWSLLMPLFSNMGEREFMQLSLFQLEKIF